MGFLRSFRRCLIGVIAVGLLALLFPLPRFAPDGVDPRVAGMRRPFKQVVVGYYLDGGSIGIQVVDRAGLPNSFSLPVEKSGDHIYKTLVAGTMWVTKTNLFPAVELDKKTWSYLCRIIELQTQPDANGTLALLYLRGAPRDYLRWGWRVLLTKF